MDPARLQRLLRQHVATDQLLGIDIVPMNAPAVAEAPPAAAQPAAPAQQPPVQQPSPAAPPPAQRPPANAPAGPPDHPAPSHQPAAREAPLAPHGRQFPTSPAADVRPQPIQDVHVPQFADTIAMDDKVKALQLLDSEKVTGCTACPLCKTRTNTVFGEGNPSADLMFIGEGPGADEDLSGRPFVGRAGKKLDDMIAAMGLSRDDVFIANIVKCRPPNNRVPTPAETETCTPYLLEQIRLIQPKAIVSLGGSSTKYLLQTSTGITRLRGQWHEFKMLQPDGPVVPLMPTFHPSFLIRQYTQENRKKVWEDLKAVLKLLGLKPPKK